MNSTSNTNMTETENTVHEAKPHAANSDENRWVARFEEILKVKNMDELKSEFAKLATEVQSEIQSFDINAHLSPEAKSRLKVLEQRCNSLTRYIQKAQKQFDREFNKSLRVLKRTRQDAEKHLQNIKSKIKKHKGTILQASKKLQNKIQKTTKKANVKSKSTAHKKTARKKTTTT